MIVNYDGNGYFMKHSLRDLSHIHAKYTLQKHYFISLCAMLDFCCTRTCLRNWYLYDLGSFLLYRPEPN